MVLGKLMPSHLSPHGDARVASSPTSTPKETYTQEAEDRKLARDYHRNLRRSRGCYH